MNGIEITFVVCLVFNEETNFVIVNILVGNASLLLYHLVYQFPQFKSIIVIFTQKTPYTCVELI